MTNAIPTETPVILFAFNRPDLLAGVIHALSQQTQLPDCIIAYIDGPRHAQDDADARACEALIQAIDFCPVTCHRRPQNVGCRRNIREGIDSVLQRYAQAIILEDDIAPNPHFIATMSQMLEHYKDQPNIASVSGFPAFLHSYWDAHSPNQTLAEANDLVLSPMFPVWGWGTWRSSWQKYGRVKTALARLLFYPLKPELIEVWLFNLFSGLGLSDCWINDFVFQVIQEKGMHLWTARAMVVNIGIEHDKSTHTKTPLQRVNSRYSPDYQPNIHNTIRIPYSPCFEGLLGFIALLCRKTLQKLVCLVTKRELHLGRFHIKRRP